MITVLQLYYLLFIRTKPKRVALRTITLFQPMVQLTCIHHNSLWQLKWKPCTLDVAWLQRSDLMAILHDFSDTPTHHGKCLLLSFMINCVKHDRYFLLMQSLPQLHLHLLCCLVFHLPFGNSIHPSHLLQSFLNRYCKPPLTLSVG